MITSMGIKKALGLLGLSGFLGFVGSPESQTRLRVWLLEMHVRQVELLKIEWGQPGLCTKWDCDYEPESKSCGRRGKLTERKFAK